MFLFKPTDISRNQSSFQCVIIIIEYGGIFFRRSRRIRRNDHLLHSLGNHSRPEYQLKGLSQQNSQFGDTYIPGKENGRTLQAK